MTHYDYIRNYVKEFEEENNRPFVAAIDFDGTLCEEAYPEIGAEKPMMLILVKTLQQLGVYTILWTCRSKERLEEAKKWCIERGLTFDKYNEHADCFLEKYPNQSPKIYADIYIDDKAHNALKNAKDIITLAKCIKDVC